MSDGAVDHDYDDAERPYVARVSEALANVQTEPVEGGVAIDIVTRQAVFVRQRKYDDLAEHYDAEGYSLATYKMHPWLPGISVDDAVFEVSYIDGNPQNAHKQGKTYDMPRSRLMHLPVEMSWNDTEIGDV